MTKQRRVCILLMDSFGIGASRDAADYGDAGANTFGRIYEACAQGLANKEGVRTGSLHLPNLEKLGLYHAALAGSGLKLQDLGALGEPQGHYGYAVEQSLGKDTPSGHWEIAGVPVFEPWGYFEHAENTFPKPVLQVLIQHANLPGFLGLKHASGTEIITELGQAHVQTGKPIIYTSADSVFQIAAHETHFGLERLYALCEKARELLDEYRIGRVIARPFVGEAPFFKRSANRRDYSMPPPQSTLLDKLKEKGREVIAIGKVADIYAHSGVTQVIKADGNMALFDATLKALEVAPAGSLIFTNFVDFDSCFGHRRDIIGYAEALEAFDKRLLELHALLKEDDLVLITADHGCDPTFPGSDHTREHVPVLVFGPKLGSVNIGRRDTFADMGQSIAEYLDIEPLDYGVSFLSPGRS